LARNVKNERSLSRAIVLAVAKGTVMSKNPESSFLLAQLERSIACTPNLDLAASAVRLGVSRRTLQRVLGREGLTFHVVRTRVRLVRAEALLSETSVKISAIADEIGFASQGHFIVWFRRYRGVTPGVWRTSSRGAPESPG
jgi:AraC-like DNA-binding protein